MAQTALYILGKETYYRGPTVAGVALVNGRTLEVSIRHREGTDFTPSSGITGWEVLVAETPVPVRRVYRQDPETIRISLGTPVTNQMQASRFWTTRPCHCHWRNTAVSDGAFHLLWLKIFLKQGMWLQDSMTKASR